jgi:hypothetical protein
MGKTRKKSWSSYGDDDETGDSIFANNPFFEAIAEYINSPEGELQLEVDDVVWDRLKDVHVDAEKRLFLWPDAERLTIEQSVARLAKQFPDYPYDFIECSLIGWLEQGYKPENYSEAQMAELDRLTERWVADHERRALSHKKKESVNQSYMRSC